MPQMTGGQALVESLKREALTHDRPAMIEVPIGPMPNFQRQPRERQATDGRLAARASMARCWVMGDRCWGKTPRPL